MDGPVRSKSEERRHCGSGQNTRDYTLTNWYCRLQRENIFSSGDLYRGRTLTTINKTSGDVGWNFAHPV